ncbi:hypothetical protein HanIR_Chr02g0051821 [Helianthus annuus]|nr:hypothetical protein HanIR_Chr02g0051821 [Helianthus annuus]
MSMKHASCLNNRALRRLITRPIGLWLQLICPCLTIQQTTQNWIHK